VATSAASFDDFGRHVHGRAGHGALFATACSIVYSQSPSLAGDELGSAEVDEFDDTVVV
jgi:hypothetical protein